MLTGEKEPQEVNLLEVSQKDRKTTQKRRDQKARQKADKSSNGYDTLAFKLKVGGRRARPKSMIKSEKEMALER